MLFQFVQLEGNQPKSFQTAREFWVFGGADISFDLFLCVLYGVREEAQILVRSFHAVKRGLTTIFHRLPDFSITFAVRSSLPPVGPQTFAISRQSPIKPQKQQRKIQ